MSMSVSNLLRDKSVASFTKGVAGAVYMTTAIKAIGRPAFIYADKNSDQETKKYTAGKEFLYQILCLGLTFAMILPAQRLGFKMAKKHMKDIKELEGIKSFKEFETVTKDLNELSAEAKTILGGGVETLSKESKSALKLVKGGGELGSFVASILGLTLVAPLISHKILHPVMKWVGLDKKHNAKPTIEEISKQPFLDKTSKVDLKV